MSDIAERLGKIEAKIDKLDEAIRGNGKPGINTRLDRLEGAESRRSRIVWLMAGAVIVASVSQIARAIFG